jgi:hypothetical protein
MQELPAWRLEGHCNALCTESVKGNKSFGWPCWPHGIAHPLYSVLSPLQHRRSHVALGHTAGNACRIAPRSPRWERPRPSIMGELTPSKRMNKSSSELLEEERACDIIVPVMGAPFCLLLLLVVLVIERLCDSVSTHGVRFSFGEWASRVSGTPQMRVMAASAAPVLAACAAVSFGTARFAGWLMRCAACVPDLQTFKILHAVSAAS